MKVVVTGGAGFIGSHLVELWLNKNAEVHVLDDLSSGKIENLFPEAIFHKGSITDRNLVFKVLEGATFVHHLAAFVSVAESMEKPFKCVEINVNGLLNVLDACKEHKIKKLVYTSSAAVYGENPESPKTTKTQTIPKSPYGITKLDGEFYLEIYRESFGLENISLRYFNVFGERQDEKNPYAAAIPIFFSKALKNEPITIFGDGNQTRDFIFVKDVAKANFLAATSTKNGIFNVASGKATTIKELVNLIIKITKSKSEVHFAEERKGEIKHSLASIEQTTNQLGFLPETELEEGLRILANFYRKN